MSKKLQLTQNEKNLIRRYLVWCYKTTKEELDKIDRYFTQIKADDFMLKQLRKAKEYNPSADDKAYRDLVDQFQVYMKKKETGVLKKKFRNGKNATVNTDYQYLHNRFISIEKAICYFLGAKELKNICFLYEQEMTGRILEAREHT